METSKHIVFLFLLLSFGALNCISQEHVELNNNLELIELADSSSQGSNLKQGLYKTYYSNGIIKEELFYKDGKLHGQVRKYDSSGYLEKSSNYKNGVLNGVSRKYFRGELNYVIMYKDGKIVDSRKSNKSTIHPLVSEMMEESGEIETDKPLDANTKVSTDLKNEETVDLKTTEFKYLSYFLKLKRQIEKEWKYPKESRPRGEFGEVLLIFTLQKDGALKEIKILTSSGYPRLDDEAQRAIKAAAPYAAFPEKWGELEKLNIRATFEYKGKPIF